jgi:hypothetical protein
MYIFEWNEQTLTNLTNVTFSLYGRTQPSLQFGILIRNTRVRKDFGF